MFLHYLTDPQQRAFFNLADQMINADHIVAAAETCYRDLLLREAGFGQAAPASDNRFAHLLDLFDDRQSQTTLIIELLVLAIIDGSYRPEEASFVQSVVEYFDFSETDQNRFNRLSEKIAASITGFWDILQIPGA